MHDEASPQIPCSHTRCLLSTVRHIYPDAHLVSSQHGSSQNIQSTPSLVLSALAVCAFTVKLGVSAVRLYRGTRSVRSILKAGLCSMLFVASVLLLIFSILSNEKAPEVLLSLISRLMIIYQCVLLWQFFDWPYWIRFSAAILQLLCTICTLVFSSLIAKNFGHTEIGHTEAWRITTLSSFAAEYILLDALYLWKIRRWKDRGSKTRECTGPLCSRTVSSKIFSKQTVCVRCILWWNIFFSAIAWALATAFLFFYLFGGIDYIISLWIDIAAGAAWIVRWLVIQSYAFGGSGPNAAGSDHRISGQQSLSGSQKLILSIPRKLWLVVQSSGTRRLKRSPLMNLIGIVTKPSHPTDMKLYQDRWKDLERQNRARLDLPLSTQWGTCNTLQKYDGVLSDSETYLDTCQPLPPYEALSRSPAPEGWRTRARKLDPRWDLQLPLMRKEGAKRVTKEPRFRIRRTPDAIRENITSLSHSASPKATNP